MYFNLFKAYEVMEDGFMTLYIEVILIILTKLHDYFFVVNSEIVFLCRGGQGPPQGCRADDNDDEVNDDLF